MIRNFSITYILTLTLVLIVIPDALLQTETIENLDNEYSVSEIQSIFSPWWEEDWEETVTGFRIMGSSFDLHTLHTLQHWKGTFPFSDYFFFCFDYFTDASQNAQFYKQEIELKYRVKRNHYISLFGYPYFDKKESDVGIRYSYEETPLDFIKLSILFENGPNNYTYKDRSQDSMRIYTRIPVLYSIDISVIKKETNRCIISFNIEPPYKIKYENSNGEIIYRERGEYSRISIKESYRQNSTRFGWSIDFLYKMKDYSPDTIIVKNPNISLRLIPRFFLVKSIGPFYDLHILYNSDFEEESFSKSISRRGFLMGIIRNFSNNSKIGLYYCNGRTRNTRMEKTRTDNRLLLSIEQRFNNKSRVGLNLGIELDSRDTSSGYLRRYDKLFLFLQHRIE